MKCYCCGVEKDVDAKETYPFDDGHITQKFPIPALTGWEVQGDDNRSDGSWDFRMPIFCLTCLHKIMENGPDMWLGEGEWDVLNPIIPFAELPKMIEFDEDPDDKKPGAWREAVSNPKNYPDLVTIKQAKEPGQ